jgi:tyrosine aminotransferase
LTTFNLLILYFQHHATITFDLLSEVPGLKPIKPKGAMYQMIQIELEKFPEFSSCLEFTEALISEESIQVFPGFPCFDFAGFFRIVLTVPEDQLIEACGRIKEFCQRHLRK